MATFEERLKLAIGPRGYETYMRRSVQTTILYESHRAIAQKLPSLRPFQRKIAFWSQAKAILDSLDFLQDDHKSQIMWRTATSKEPMPPETSWKRLRLIERELSKILGLVKPLIVEGRSHDEVCEMFVQQEFNEVTGNKGKQHPVTFEFTHNNVIFCYRVFFRGVELDPTFPPPVARQFEVPIIKPKVGPAAMPPELVPFMTVAAASNVTKEQPAVAVAVATGPKTTAVASVPAEEDEDDDDDCKADSGVATGAEECHQERMSLLKEVREHLDLLREFEGVISQDEINRKKRNLFLALPPAPPPAMKRKKET